MTNDNFEKEMKSFDYSVFSKVKDSLLDKLLQKHRADNATNFKSLSQLMKEEFMSDEELDYVAAAGNPTIKNDIPEKIENILAKK